MVRSLVVAGGIVAAVLLLQLASAQTLYKSTMPDGKVVYGDKPVPGAVKVDESKPDTSKKGVAPPVAREAAVLKQLEKDRKARESEQDRLRRAEQALHQAEVAQELGKEPQPYERQGTAGGNQRLTDAYWERQKMLEQNVENARRNLEKVRSGK